MKRILNRLRYERRGNKLRLEEYREMEGKEKRGPGRRGKENICGCMVPLSCSVVDINVRGRAVKDRIEMRKGKKNMAVGWEHT